VIQRQIALWTVVFQTGGPLDRARFGGRFLLRRRDVCAKNPARRFVELLPIGGAPLTAVIRAPVCS